MDLDHDVPLETDPTFDWSEPDYLPWFVEPAPGALLYEHEIDPPFRPVRIASDRPCWPTLDLFPRLSRLFRWSRPRG